VTVTRSATEADLDEIWRIQSACGQAAPWNPADYLSHQCLVAMVNERIAGFAVARHTAPDEVEILNLAVDPLFRRRGIGRSLIQKLLANHAGSTFLEVRESNLAARKLYHSLGFEAIAVRKNYYNSSGESAIVMKFHSCYGHK
jgi:ribosomal-protein-alanine N-acetyltransferase